MRKQEYLIIDDLECCDNTETAKNKVTIIIVTGIHRDIKVKDAIQRFFSEENRRRK